MAQPSLMQVLGGPLGGQRLEFRGNDVFVGSAPDCAVRLDASGVEAHHARIVIELTGATIYAVDGVLGVNDDLVSGEALLRSGDFVWIGEPGGASSMMLQFTLGDLGEPSHEGSPDATLTDLPAPMLVEEVVSEEIFEPEEPAEELILEEA
ncbi:MAG: FHA domain-containing protein, partial [Vicinamibacteria bacterium]|nr:FHA domain-containing protein [Vicinamibacteria bacterium]